MNEGIGHVDTLAIIGAGPKAVAIQAKAHALRSLGLPAPEITVIEPRGVAANWRAVGGWTDGRHPLGTPPEKDVGFPYRTRIAGPRNRAVDQELLGLGWVSFMAESGRYASWVDRGRPFPPHDTFAEYLGWVAERTGMNIVRGAATRLVAGDDAWTVSVDGAGDVVADALLVTGAGPSDGRLAERPEVLSIAGFWKRGAGHVFPEGSRIAVIGGGESAASVVAEVIRHPVSSLTIIAPQSTLFSRGEGQFENGMYTNPDQWAQLSERDRVEFISRTDRGVFSVRVQQQLHEDERVRHVRGLAASVSGESGRPRLRVEDARTGGSEHEFDYIIDARGGRPLWFLELMDAETRGVLAGVVGGEIRMRRLEDAIGAGLEVEGMAPRLILPTLAGFRQGPGFANLSCLGELSDRVLGGLPGASARAAAGAGS